MLAFELLGGKIDLHNCKKVNNKNCCSADTGIVESNYARLVIDSQKRRVEHTADGNEDKQNIDRGAEDRTQLASYSEDRLFIAVTGCRIIGFSWRTRKSSLSPSRTTLFAIDIARNVDRIFTTG